MIYVKNKKLYRGDGVYIGRPSVFGNPYPLSKSSSMLGRLQVIESYRSIFYEWLRSPHQDNENFRQKLVDLAQIARNGDLYLICWCDPLPCHGDVIKEFIEDFIGGRKNIYGEEIKGSQES